MSKQISLLKNYDDTLSRWYDECLKCQRCGLHRNANRVVFGEGNSNAKIMLVGEAPGAEEDRLGRPFVGKAGQLLNKILAAYDLTRKDVYITNVVKCRPPKNRIPTKQEIKACLPFLEKQIEIINPFIIVCLGSTAARTLIRSDFSITRERGKWHKDNGRLIMPTFHPAALLRDVKKKRPVWQDFQQIMAVYRKILEKEQTIFPFA